MVDTRANSKENSKASPSNGSVLLHVYGVRQLVPKPLDAQASLSMTWDHFFNNVCGLHIEAGKGVRVCSSSYRRTSTTGAWVTEDLSEPIENFMNHFRMKKRKYSVQLRLETDAARDVDQSKSESKDATQESTRSLSSVSSKVVRFTGETDSSIDEVRAGPSSSSTSGKGVKRAFSFELSSLPFKKRRYSETAEESMVNNWSSEDAEGRSSDFDGTDLILCDRSLDEDALMEANENECIQEGVESEVIRGRKQMQPVISKRLSGFSNSFLLLAQNEIKRLQRKGIWTRNVQRAPLSCYMIQELLK